MLRRKTTTIRDFLVVRRNVAARVGKWEVYLHQIISQSLVQHNAVELGLEPTNRLVLGDAVVGSDPGLLLLAPGNPVSGPAKDNVEIKTVDTDGGVVLQTKIDVLCHKRKKETISHKNKK